MYKAHKRKILRKGMFKIVSENGCNLVKSNITVHSQIKKKRNTNLILFHYTFKLNLLKQEFVILVLL
jgi:hypothetical protein